MSNDNNNRRDRKPYAGGRSQSGSRPQGSGRRVYPDAAGPRVGRVATNVPRARQVDAEDDVPAEERGAYKGNNARRAPAAPNATPGQGIREKGAGNREQGTGIAGDRPSPDYSNSTLHTPHSTLHRGSAYRAPSGPRQYKREPQEPDGLAAELPDEEHLLAGRNPIREALKAGRPVEKLLVASGELSGSAREIIRLARDAGAVVQQVDRSRLDAIYPAHQGMLAYVAAAAYAEVSDMLAAAAERREDPFLILLDGITDPHNLGAIVRSAECAGAHGVVIPERRAAGLTPAAAKAAAGALNHLPIARVKNLNRVIEELQARNIWVIGTAMDGEDALTADLSGPVALVIGSEGEGISRLTLEKCDRTISLPMKGHIESLNASVAAGILMYEVVRARAK